MVLGYHHNLKIRVLVPPAFKVANRFLMMEILMNLAKENDLNLIDKKELLKTTKAASKEQPLLFLSNNNNQ